MNCPDCNTKGQRNGYNRHGRRNYRCPNPQCPRKSFSEPSASGLKGRPTIGDGAMTAEERVYKQRACQGPKRRIKYALVDDASRSESGLLTRECFKGIVWSNSRQNARREGFSAVLFSGLSKQQKRWAEDGLQEFSN